MPLIEVKMVEGVFTDSQKNRMIKDLTDVMVAIEGERLRPYTVVVLHEVKTGDWGVGGEAMTAENIRKVAAGVT
jgi:4-oxalocrotonate tautomerase